MTTTLRDELRTRTAEAHQSVDDTLSALDLTTPDGLARYLSCHAMVLAGVEPVLSAAPGLPAFPDALPLLAADLQLLGRSMPERSAEAQGPLDPLGIAYVIAGSHLGARILERRWAQSSDATVLQAHNFVTDRSFQGYWKGLSLPLARRDLSAPRVEEVVQGAIGCFALYRSAFEWTGETSHHGR